MSRGRLRTAMLGSLLWLTQAQAQDLAAYRQLASILDRAAVTAPDSLEEARTDLTEAQAVFRTLAPSLVGGQAGGVAGGLGRTIAQAREATGRTPAEVQANVLLARGLMRRTLYDAVMGDLRQGGEAAVRDTLPLLGRELGFTAASLSTLQAQARAGQVEQVGRRLRRVAADKLRFSLEQVAVGEAQTQNYLNLTRASSWFSLVQEDAGRAAPPLVVGQFDRALQAVASGDDASLQTELSQMRPAAADLSRTLQGSVARAAPPAAGRASENTGTQTLHATYAALAQAQTAAGHGDAARARDLLTRVTPLLGQLPAELRRTRAFAQFERDVRALRDRGALRPSSVQALIATLGAVEAQAAGERTSGSDAFAMTSARLFGGWVRVVLALALALLTLTALRFLNLAFGGSNVYWRSIQGGFLALTLPLLLEGFFGVIGWLGDALNVGFLRGAFNLTLTQGAGGLWWQLVLGLVGVGLLTYGFRGLCQQFGLLGGRVAAAPTASHPSRYTVTNLDWDDEL